MENEIIAILVTIAFWETAYFVFQYKFKEGLFKD